MNSGCTYAFHTFSPSKLTVGQVLSLPLTSPPTTAERRAVTSVVKSSSPAGQGSYSRECCEVTYCRPGKNVNTHSNTYVTLPSLKAIEFCEGDCT